MKLHKLYLTENDCYKRGKYITPKGVMVHSTGANNPWLKRYVGPDDGLLGKNQYNNHWNQPMDREVCVHAFIGKLADGSIATYQTLPWNMRGWHCGDAANDTHISFEICEDGLDDGEYFAKVYREAVELTAYLCKAYHLAPLEEGVVICHSEGYKRGVASNHGDVMHWFPRFGRNMDNFRADVARAMEDDMTQEQFNKMMDTYLAERAKQPATMPELLEDAKKMGLTDGNRPRDFVTREECAVMARAAALKK